MFCLIKHLMNTDPTCRKRLKSYDHKQFDYYYYIIIIIKPTLDKVAKLLKHETVPAYNALHLTVLQRQGIYPEPTRRATTPPLPGRPCT